jgi:hypothetical protein
VRCRGRPMAPRAPDQRRAETYPLSFILTADSAAAHQGIVSGLCPPVSEYPSVRAAKSRRASARMTALVGTFGPPSGDVTTL